MDIAFHALAGLVVSKKLTGDYFWSVSFFSIVPDLIGGVPYHYHKVKHSLKKPPKFFISEFIKVTQRGEYFNQLDEFAYRVTHSWLMLIPISAVGLFLFRSMWWVATLGYLFHLLIDLPTHEGNFSHQPLYPLKRFSVKGRAWSRDKRIFAIFWLGLAALYLI